VATREHKAAIRAEKQRRKTAGKARVAAVKKMARLKFHPERRGRA
jgi:hypothetical protein